MAAAILALLATLAALPQSLPPQSVRPMAAETSASTLSCSLRKTCKAIATCDEAYWYLKNCDWGFRLDGDSDGIPCETLCGNGH